MNSKFCKNQLYSSLFLVCLITKLYTIFYYLHYFLLFSKFTYYFVWRNLPTNSNYFTKIYLLFSVTLMIICDASKWRRYYRRSTGYCQILPLGTTAMVRDYRPWRWYQPSTTASGLLPLVRPYVIQGDKLSAMRRGPITSLHATPAPLLVYIMSCI